jgi:hypothetical protein
MNAIAERWIGDAGASFSTAPIWNENHLRRALHPNLVCSGEHG